MTIPIQLLGIESDRDLTWLWSWAVSDHSAAFVSYLKFYRVDYTVEDAQVVARNGNSQLTAEFDHLSRLKRIQGNFSPINNQCIES